MKVQKSLVPLKRLKSCCCWLEAYMNRLRGIRILKIHYEENVDMGVMNKIVVFFSDIVFNLIIFHVIYIMCEPRKQENIAHLSARQNAVTDFALSRLRRRVVCWWKQSFKMIILITFFSGKFPSIRQWDSHHVSHRFLAAKQKYSFNLKNII